MAKLEIEYSEEQLETYLCNHLDKHFPNLKLIKRQYGVPDGRIDMLCKATDEDNDEN